MSSRKTAAKRLKLTELSLYYRNPRRGDIQAIASSLSANGQYKPIVVNQGSKTGRVNEVLAGNHTVQAAAQLGWRDLDCWLVDVDDTEAARIVAADNRTSELGSFDLEELLSLISEIPDLDGTGYTADDIEMLEKIVAGPQFDDFPDVEQGDDKPKEKVSTAVVCPSCEHEFVPLPRTPK